MSKRQPVFIVIQGVAYEGDTVEGVYSDEAKANDVAKEQARKFGWPFLTESRASRDHYRVDKHEVN